LTGSAQSTAGRYMLFLVDGAGIPSPAAMIKLT
jgi:hypothetical protein